MIPAIRLPRVLLTNDDGIDAPGLALLAEIAAAMADEVWIVAPAHERSGASMQISLSGMLRVTELGARRYAVSGTPSDCVALALRHLMKDKPPQLLLSGINAGTNLGDEANLSGTVGAALTGLVFGVPSIAISQERGGHRAVTWDAARAHLPGLLQILLHLGWRRDCCLSVNIPDTQPELIRDIAWTRQGHHSILGLHVEERIDPRDNKYYLLAVDRNTQIEPDPLSDVAAVRRKRIAVSCLTLDRSIEPGKRLMPLDPNAPDYNAST